jgi:heparanase 1
MKFLSFSSTCKIEKPKEKLFSMPDTFLSVTIDISFLLGGKWWGPEPGVKRGVSVSTIDPLDIKNPVLIHWSKYLSPFLIRIGGTEADRVYYRVGSKKQLKQEPVQKHRV